MRRLHVASGLTLNADYIGGGTLALLAKKGAGKSYTARVLAEEMWEAKIPFVLMDPMGTSWGLRAGADGTENGGLPVPIFGGDHGDAPLERTGGGLMADLIVDEGLSMIVDLSALGSRAAERQFAHDFFDRLYRRNRELVHLLVDEADLFAPQKPQPGDAPLLGVTENIVRRGRNRGIGITLITQRPAVLNKDVLTQVDGLVAMRIIGKQDRDAIDAWVMGHGDQEAAAEVKGTLAGLANGECWWWIPELDILKRVQVRASRTFDSSPTKRIGESTREPKSLADIDMGAIETKMSATIERAKADDPRELRRRIAGLEKQLRERPEAAEPERVEVEVPVEVSVLTVDDRAILGRVCADLNDAAAGAREAHDLLSTALAKLSVNGRPRAEQVERREIARPAAKASAREGVAPARRPAPPTADPDTDVKLKAGARRILGTLARHHPMRMTKAQLGTLAKFKITGGTFGTYYSTIKRHGLIDDTAGEISLTDAGLDYVGHVPQSPQTTDELLDMWRGSLKAGARAMLDVLVDEHPDELSRDDLAERVSMEPTGGTFGTYLGTLRRNGLIDVEGGMVRASDTLFIGASA